MKSIRTLLLFLLFSLSMPFLFISQVFGALLKEPAQYLTVVSDSTRKPVRTYTTSRLSTARPVIDGKLNDPCWATGNWSGDFTQFIPSEGAKPTFPTYLKILYDDKNIYVAIRSIDPEPSKIQRYAGMRDEILGDMVGIDLDSYHDYRTGFEFNLSAYGQKVDLVLTNPMNWDVNWNAVWKGKVGLEDSAWTAEMEIPLSQLRFSREPEQVWGMHVWRWIGRLQEESDWEVQTLTGPGMLYNFGELHGIRDLKRSQRLEIMPYALGSVRTFEKQPSNPFASAGRLTGGNAGLDAKIGISSNFTVDLTLNPDFGQVESDPSVMNLTAFETFYEEKRPFFLEARNIFNYEFDDLNLFYSRRIGHAPSYAVPTSDSLFSKSPDRTTILSALKLSGKTPEGLSVGFLQSLTASEFAQVSKLDGLKSKTRIEPLTSYTVARVQKDYHEGNTVLGGIFTSTNRVIRDAQLEFLAHDAYTGGLDFLHQWKERKYYLDTRLVGSYVTGTKLAILNLENAPARYYQRPGAAYLPYDTAATRLTGSGGKIKLGKGTGLWRYSTALNWKSPGLELNDIGYMQIADMISNGNEISYFVNQPVSIFRTYTLKLEQFNLWNFNNDYLGSGAHLSLYSEYKNKWGSDLNLIYESPSLDTRILRGGPAMKVPASWYTFGSVRTDYSLRVSGNISYEYQHNAENTADRFSISPGIVLRPINSLKISFSASYGENRNKLQYIEPITDSIGIHYLLSTLRQKTLGFTLRADYSITPEISFQYYGSPFVSQGVYSDLIRITDPLAGHFDQRFVPENGDPGSNNFNFGQFRSNLVFRWEYRPGSFLYLVWSDERTSAPGTPMSNMGPSYRNLWKIHPGNVFLIKFNYWFSI